MTTSERTHELKTDPEVFQASYDELKTFEIRFNDREFKPGDWMLLRETLHSGEEMKAGAPLAYTGRTLRRQIAHVLTGYGLQEGWCCLSYFIHPLAFDECKNATLATEAQGFAVEAIDQMAGDLDSRDDNLVVMTPAQAEKLLRRMWWKPPCEGTPLRRFKVTTEMPGHTPLDRPSVREFIGHGRFTFNGDGSIDIKTEIPR